MKTEPRESVGNLNNSVVSDMKSAVPGTPVPEKRNWVVGKFGRVLPVVFLRRKDGRKVAKFDPSKTVHCVKKIRVDDEKFHSVNNLTWDIESSCADVCEISKKRDPKKRVADDVQGKDESKIPNKARRKSKDFKIETEIVCPLDVTRCGFEDKSISSFQYGEMSRSDESNDENPSDSEIHSLENNGGSTDVNKDELVAHKFDVDVNPLNCRNADSHVSDDSDKDLSNDSNVSTDDDNSSKIGSNLHEEKQNKSKETKVSPHNDESDASSSIIASDTSPNISVNGCDKNTNKVISRNHQRNSLNNDDICSTDSLSDSSSEDNSSGLNNNILSNKVYQTSGSKASMSKLDNTSSKSKHSLFNTDVTSTTKKSLKTENEGIRESDLKKREVSNSLRLESLKERTQVIQKQKDIVKNALQKIDSDQFKGSNHVILDGNDEGLDIPAEGKVWTFFPLYHIVYIS